MKRALTTHDQLEREKTIERQNACDKIARTPHKYNKSANRRHVRFKRDINPLSSIFDKESKATSINVFCCHSYPTANKRKNDTSDDNTLPPTKQTTVNQQGKLRAAMDPGNKILDEGKGKNNLHASFIDNTTKTGSPPLKHEIAGPDKTAALLPGLAPPTLQITGKPIKGNNRGQHRKENKQKRRLHQAIQP
jgi:hypothetical protein